MKKSWIIIGGWMVFCAACYAQDATQAPDWSKNEALRVIFNRKSVRHYTGKKVSKEDLQMLVRAGMAAPTAMDKRPWVFIVVTDQSLLDRLADGLPYAKMLPQAKAAIVVCGDANQGISGRENILWVHDCSAASENILLAAEAMGLGAVWTGVYPLIERLGHVQKVLEIPSNVYPLSVIAVGYPVGDEKAKDKFEPSKIYWDRWQTNF
jgi:nitroreductase